MVYLRHNLKRMRYAILKEVIGLLEEFETANLQRRMYNDDIEGFKRWIIDNYEESDSKDEPDWEGKELGRSAESVINTLIVHMNRYAKTYSKSAIFGSDFSTQEDFIYLINLNAFGPLTKMELIKKNVHEKPAGMQVINRLIDRGWATQMDYEFDKRSKVVQITDKGIEVLENQMSKIREATQIVTGDLTHNEKMELIRLLQKLDSFHKPIYEKNIDPKDLLNEVVKDKGG